MQLIEVEWLDSATQDGWQFKPGRGVKAAPCRTAGYLIHETKSRIVIAGSISPEQVMSPLTIPKVAITRRRRLK